jgi:hypothetical protein
MMRCRANLLLSVRRITQTNKGKATAGIDKEVINTPEQRVKLVSQWKGGNLLPTRRVLIPKSNGKKRPLIKIAYQNAYDEFIRVLIILIEQENTQHGSIHILYEIKCCWNERLAEVLLDKIQDEKLKAGSTGDLLKELLVYRVDRAKAFAESLISLPPPTHGEARAKAVIAAQMLMVYAEDAGWSVVWSAIQQDPEFGREVLEAVSYAIKYEGNIEQRLKEDYVADLYIFPIQQYPDSDVEQREDSENKELTGVEAYAVGAEDSIKIWRDYIPQRLQERGTREACAALQKIIYELPELKDSLQWRLLGAEALTRRQTWQPPQPGQIFQIVSKKASLFELCADHVECVLLNACYSEVQSDAIIQHIAHVIGMSDAIGDTAAIKFSTGFYDALGAGKTIETAYKFGCNAIQLENIPGNLTPRLKKRQEF